MTINRHIRLRRLKPFSRMLKKQSSVIVPKFVGKRCRSRLTKKPKLCRRVFRVTGMCIRNKCNPVSRSSLCSLVVLKLVSTVGNNRATALSVCCNQPSLPLFKAMPTLRTCQSVNVQATFNLISESRGACIRRPGTSFLHSLPPGLTQRMTSSPVKCT